MTHPHTPWEKHEKLVGRTIVSVGKMTDNEINEWGVDAIVLELDNGSRWWLSSDEEGSRGGDIHQLNE
jgi:hypothetical protein